MLFGKVYVDIVYDTRNFYVIPGSSLDGARLGGWLVGRLLLGWLVGCLVVRWLVGKLMSWLVDVVGWLVWLVGGLVLLIRTFLLCYSFRNFARLPKRPLLPILVLVDPSDAVQFFLTSPTLSCSSKLNYIPGSDFLKLGPSSACRRSSPCAAQFPPLFRMHTQANINASVRV